MKSNKSYQDGLKIRTALQSKYQTSRVSEHLIHIHIHPITFGRARRHLIEFGVLETVLSAVGNFTILSRQSRPHGYLGRHDSGRVRLGNGRNRRGQGVKPLVSPIGHFFAARLWRIQALDSDVQRARVFLPIVLPPAPYHPERWGCKFESREGGKGRAT